LALDQGAVETDVVRPKISAGIEGAAAPTEVIRLARRLSPPKYSVAGEARHDRSAASMNAI
jgi:hypothetical protein